MAAAYSFLNGFTPTEKMYVCSVQPEYFEGLIAGPTESGTTAAGPDEKVMPEDEPVLSEEKKEDLVC
jgi:hypothetical protein